MGDFDKSVLAGVGVAIVVLLFTIGFVAGESVTESRLERTSLLEGQIMLNGTDFACERTHE